MDSLKNVRFSGHTVSGSGRCALSRKADIQGERQSVQGEDDQGSASTYVGVKKNISLVEIPGALLVLGVTNDAINLLAKIEDEEVLRKFSEPEEEKISGSFSDQLRKLVAGYRRDK